jgi:hypothetical protein
VVSIHQETERFLTLQLHGDQRRGYAQYNLLGLVAVF